jgi:hypothetical protein
MANVNRMIRREADNKKIWMDKARQGHRRLKKSGHKRKRSRNHKSKRVQNEVSYCLTMKCKNQHRKERRE